MHKEKEKKDRTRTDRTIAGKDESEPNLIRRTETIVGRETCLRPV